MGSERQKIEVTIDTSQLENGLGRIETETQKILDRMQKDWEATAKAVTTMGETLNLTADAVIAWTEKAGNMTAAMTEFGNSGETAGNSMTNVVGILGETASAAMGAVAGVQGLGVAFSTSMGIISLVATAINLVITLFENLEDAGSESMKRMNQTTEELSGTTEALTDSAVKSGVAYAQTLGSIAAQSVEVGGLISRLEELRSATEQTSSTQAEMREISGRLIELVPQFSLYLDENTGILRANSAQMEAVVRSARNMALVQAIEDGQATGLEKTAQNLTSNLQSIQKFGEDMQTLIGSGLHPALVKEFEDMSADDRATAKVWADAVRENGAGAIDEINGLAEQIPGTVSASMEGLGEAGYEGFVYLGDGIEQASPEINASAQSVMESAAGETSASIESADFSGKGSKIVQNMAYGAMGNAALADMMDTKIRLAAFRADSSLATADFTAKGEKILDDMAKGVLDNMTLGETLAAKITSINENLPKIKIEVDSHIPLPHFAISGEFSAKNRTVPEVYISGWHDKGGLFDAPAIIGIAEKRPEFVGAAQDLRSFINGAVATAFSVKGNPALGNVSYGGDTIHFNPQVTINAQKLTDAEMKRATEYVSREFAKTVTGRKVGKIS